jgi:hypothetical protein
MTETPKRKGGGIPQWIIWEREYEYVVPLSVEECLSRLIELSKKRRAYAPKIHSQMEIDGTNSRLLMKFTEGKLGPIYTMIYLIQLDLISTRVSVRLGFPVAFIFMSFVFPLLYVVLFVFLKGVEYVLLDFLTRTGIWMMIGTLLTVMMGFVYLVSYLVFRPSVLTYIKATLGLLQKSK